jgi:nitrite reductase (NADH) small subunit
MASMSSTIIECVIGPLAQIPPGEGRVFDVEGRRIAVFRTRDGTVSATQASCPHRGGPLADGIMGSGTIVCPLHSWKFNLATGAALLGDCGITTYPARLNEQGLIVLMLDAEG